MSQKKIKNEHLRSFAEAGFRVCILGHKESESSPIDFDKAGKIPAFGFTKVPFNPKPDVKKFPHNWGIVLDPDHLVIDVDPRNFPEGEDSWKNLQLDLCINFEKLCRCKQQTGGGGFHYFLKKPRGLLVVNELEDYKGVEFKSVGRQVVGPGSIHPETGKPYVLIDGSNPSDIVDAPEELLALIERPDIKLDKGLDGFDDSEGNKSLLRQALSEHPAAIQGENGDHTTFQAAAICRDMGVSQPVALELLEEYNERCDPPWTLDDLQIKIRNAYRYGQNAVGSKNPKSDFDVIIDEKAEENVKKAVVAEPDFIDDIENNWAYSIATKSFYDLRNLRRLDKEMFDDIHAGKTDRKKPSAFAIMHPGMPKVMLPTYWPGQDRFVEEDGEKKINLYRAPNVKTKKGDVTKFKEFVDYLIGEDKAWLFHDFVAYLLRNPGEKVLWAILLQGKPGVGKSLLARALMGVFGKNNVSQPTNDEIHDKYTGWLKASQLVVVHELMARGRLEMMNKLKDPITEPTINVREMYSPPYEITNRANFLFLTNYEDSIIIPKDDRRLAVIFSEAEKRDPEYYDGLVDWVNANTGVLLNYYLHEHKYDAQFKPKAPAPMTKEKGRMIDVTRHPIESTLMDMLEDEAAPMHGNLADISLIMDKLKGQHKAVNYLTLGIHMKNCGFVPIGDRLRLKNGSRVRLWAIRNVEMLKKEPIETVKNLYEKQEEEYESKMNGEVLKSEFKGR